MNNQDEIIVGIMDTKTVILKEPGQAPRVVPGAAVSGEFIRTAIGGCFGILGELVPCYGDGPVTLLLFNARGAVRHLPEQDVFGIRVNGPVLVCGFDGARLCGVDERLIASVLYALRMPHSGNAELEGKP